jgi:16S rRNA (cytidine1402-2'-O)-methyltransferase
MPGILYLVSTPIGNLEDITLRALRILKEVSLIACEDTRQTNKLLQHFQIDVPTISYHDHNERERTPQLLARITGGDSIALVSDAGTPAISDPGFILVREAIEKQILVVPVPGASALLAALIASGLPTDEFFFAGFLPSRSGQRRKRLAELAKLSVTLILYESPHRIAHTLNDALEIFGPRRATIGRELTKLHEQFLRGSLSDLAEIFKNQPARGEIVLILEGLSEQSQKATEPILDLRTTVEEKMQNENIDKMTALKAVARMLGISKSEAYRRLQEEESQRLTFGGREEN